MRSFDTPVMAARCSQEMTEEYTDLEEHIDHLGHIAIPRLLLLLQEAVVQKDKRHRDRSMTKIGSY